MEKKLQFCSNLNTMNVLDKVKAEIEVLPKTYPFVNHIDMYVKEDDVKEIIGKYRSEQEEILKADYEARLTADMMAMLKDIQSEIEAVPKYCMVKNTSVYRNMEEYISDINNVIQQKINSLEDKE